MGFPSAMRHILAGMVVLDGLAVSGGERYSPTWDSLDSRPIPRWYDQAKIGVFMHWGPYAVPGVADAWFWYQWKRNSSGDREVVKFMETYYSPDFSYHQFGAELRGELFNATHWEEIVASSGAEYFVFTSKHHDGFTNWPSSRTFGWNSMDLGPRRDIVGELAAAFQTTGRVKFGLYYSLYEWFNPLYQQDKAANFTSHKYITEKVGPELAHLVNTYRPQLIWSDGDWEATPEYWHSKEFLAWLYSDSPVNQTVVTNDRWGIGSTCKHGDYLTCTDKFNPGILQKKKWENAMTIDRKSWGNRRNINLDDILTLQELLGTLAKTVSCGGNLLMNVGPTSQGTIQPIFEERLREMGKWLEQNGEAVYSTVPWSHQNDTTNPSVWYTCKTSQHSGVVVYAFLLDWPTNGQVELGSPQSSDDTQVTLLGEVTELEWKVGEGGTGVVVSLPRSLLSYQVPVIRMELLDNAANSVW